MDLKRDLNVLVLEKINFGQDLIRHLLKFAKIDGASKLQQKIKQELNFLNKMLKNRTLKQEHLPCSNLTHFAAVLDSLNSCTNCVSVNKIFYFNDRKLTVDIVCDNGLTWVKVVARNPKSIGQICMGDSSYGIRSVVDQAYEFTECAKLYPCFFQIPKVVFVFVKGIPISLSMKLDSYGVICQGEKLSDSTKTFDQNIDQDDKSNDTDYGHTKELTKTDTISNCFLCDLTSDSCIRRKNISEIIRVNVDVSAMLAYCSSVTNGSAEKYKFSEPVLAQQAKWEIQRPQKPLLDEFFKGKTLYSCETARNNFVNIIDTVGGPSEKVRAKEFLNRIIVLPDDFVVKNLPDTRNVNESEDIFTNVQYTSDKLLNIRGKIRERSLIIFTFGDRIRAVTVTANKGFISSAKQQCIHFVVHIHESRALTEQKKFAKGDLMY